ncbi:hypothetical protein D6764_02945 [Candidatus Woesearchaeota archaeon]|nr:MAG: hypothetical protein D6764_02945 [Candidatus Woesearchaeota archaeon]
MRNQISVKAVSLDASMKKGLPQGASLNPRLILAGKVFVQKNFLVSPPEEQMLEKGHAVLLMKRKPGTLPEAGELLETPVRLLGAPHSEGEAFLSFGDHESEIFEKRFGRKNVREFQIPSFDTIKSVSGVPLVLHKPHEKTCRFSVPVELVNRRWLDKIKKQGRLTVLATGAEMNSSFCILECTYDNKNQSLECSAMLSRDYGNTSIIENLERFSHDIQANLRNPPDIISADLHPSYNVSVLARRISEKLGIPKVSVQHHLAHAYSALASHGRVKKEFSAIVADGLGFGTDEKIWGGETFSGEARTGHLENHIQPGGDAATKEPWRMLFSILMKAAGEEIAAREVVNRGISEDEVSALKIQIDNRFNCPETSSCGRVLDAAACLLGLCRERTYEARPALLLESEAMKAVIREAKNGSIDYALNRTESVLSKKGILLKPVIKSENGKRILMTSPLFRFLLDNMGADRSFLALLVHYYIAQGMFEIVSFWGNENIFFTGGCAYNRIMASWLAGKGILLPRVSPGDGGIALGQAAAALFQDGKND